jgi:hypothetical protein
MAKKLTLLAMVVGALVAFAIPAMASASELTGAGVGSIVTGTSTNAKTKTSLGTLTCEKVVINTKVTANGPTVTAEQSGAGTTSVCKLGANSISITNIEVKTLSAKSATSGTANFAFQADLPGGLLCSYASKEGTTPVEYTSGGSSIKVAGTLTATPAACGTATFEGDFALSVAGTSIIID